MKKILLFSFLPFLLFAQKQSTVKATDPIDLRLAICSFATIYIGNVSDSAIADYLKKNNSNLKNCAISVLTSIESKGGNHVLFQQNYKNISVYRGQVKVNTNKQGSITSVLDNSYIISDDLIEGSFPAQNTIDSYIKSILNVRKCENLQAYFFRDEKFVKCQKITISTFDSEYKEHIIDVNGNLLYLHDLNSYYAALPDSTVSASVFLPDPITTAGVVYGAPYADNFDSDVAQLNNQRVSVNMKVYYSNDTFALKSPYVIITQFSAPDTTPPAWFYQTPNFHFTRSVGKFEDVNTFYHISTFHTYIKSLGFNTIMNYQIKIDTHALNDQDNSIFSPANFPPELFFGEGGVDDAEDADVILHEYGHAISYSAAPGTNNGSQRQALDEANGDFFASSYSRYLNSYKWENVYSWDGHNEFWPGRTTKSNKHYSNDIQNNLYLDAEIWSATMMEIWGDIGRQKIDELVIESMFGYSSGMSMTAAAHLLIQADSALNGGANYSPICYRLFTRGLVTSCANSISEMDAANNRVKMLNAPYFDDAHPITLYIPENGINKVSIYNSEGKCLANETIETKGDFQFKQLSLNSGIYFIKVVNSNTCVSFKAVRL